MLIEINKAVYLDEETLGLLSSARRVVDALHGVYTLLLGSR